MGIGGGGTSPYFHDIITVNQKLHYLRYTPFTWSGIISNIAYFYADADYLWIYFISALKGAVKKLHLLIPNGFCCLPFQFSGAICNMIGNECDTFHKTLARASFLF